MPLLPRDAWLFPQTHTHTCAHTHTLPTGGFIAPSNSVSDAVFKCEELRRLPLTFSLQIVQLRSSVTTPSFVAQFITGSCHFLSVSPSLHHPPNDWVYSHHLYFFMDWSLDRRSLSSSASWPHDIRHFHKLSRCFKQSLKCLQRRPQTDRYNR